MQWIDDIDFTEIKDCVTWLDFTDRTTLTFSSGTSIAQIKDKSGYNNHYSQATQANQPSWDGVINNRTCSKFQNSWMNSSMTTSQIGIANSNYTMIVSMATSPTIGGLGMIFANTSTPENYEMHVGPVGYHARFIPSAYVYIDATSVSADGNRHVISCKVDGTLSYIYVDNNQAPPKTAAFSTLNTTLRIGSRSTTNIRYDGNISQIVIYKRALSNNELLAITNMMNRY